MHNNGKIPFFRLNLIIAQVVRAVLIVLHIATLVRSTPERALGIRALPGDMCVLGQEALLLRGLSTPRYINGYQRITAGVITLRWTSIQSRGK